MILKFSVLYHGTGMVCLAPHYRVIHRSGEVGQPQMTARAMIFKILQILLGHSLYLTRNLKNLKLRSFTVGLLKPGPPRQ